MDTQCGKLRGKLRGKLLIYKISLNNKLLSYITKSHIYIL